MTAQIATRGAGPGLVRVGSFASVPEVLRDLGFDPRTVLSAGGFNMRIFEDPANMVSLETRGQLVAHCAAATRCEHFGLLVGQRCNLDAFGMLGLLARYSVDVQTALSSFMRYFRVHNRHASVSLTVHKDSAMLSWLLYRRDYMALDQTSDGAVAILCNILRDLCGPKIQLIEAQFDHPPPADTKPFRQFFRAPLKFNAGRNAVVFHSSWLSHTLPEIHADVRRLLQQQVEEMAAVLDDDFPAYVRAVLRAALLSGYADLDQLSKLFALHPRTMRRRLGASGSSYHQLLEEVRSDLALHLLRDSDLEVTEIAQMLQYSDPRSFIRAFRRWNGETPARWRAKRRKRVDA